MRCSKGQRLISRRLDGVLAEGLEARLAEHLAQCRACRAYADGLAALDLDLLEVPEPTPDFAARLARRLGEAPGRRWVVLVHPAFFRPIAAGLGIAAALGGFAVGSSFLLTNGSEASVRNGTVESAAGEAIDPTAEDSVESVLIAMLADGEE